MMASASGASSLKILFSIFKTNWSESSFCLLIKVSVVNPKGDRKARSKCRLLKSSYTSEYMPTTASTVGWRSLFLDLKESTLLSDRLDDFCLNPHVPGEHHRDMAFNGSELRACCLVLDIVVPGKHAIGSAPYEGVFTDCGDADSHRMPSAKLAVPLETFFPRRPRAKTIPRLFLPIVKG